MRTAKLHNLQAQQNPDLVTRQEKNDSIIPDLVEVSIKIPLPCSIRDSSRAGVRGPNGAFERDREGAQRI